MVARPPGLGRYRTGLAACVMLSVLAVVAVLAPWILLASIATWPMIHLIPGDPAIALVGPDVTPEQLTRARALMGLDRPLPVQCALWLGRVVRGDLGVSYLNGLPVSARCWPSGSR